jgi:hypothetical protein
MLRICENFEKKFNFGGYELILFLGALSTFLGVKFFWWRFLFYWGSLQLFGLPFHLIGEMILPFRGSFHFFGGCFNFFGGMKILGVLIQKIGGDHSI